MDEPYCCFCRGGRCLRRDNWCGVFRVGVNGRAIRTNRKAGILQSRICHLVLPGGFLSFRLYDFIVMHDRRELVLRLVQALGLAWIALALAFYAFPRLMLGS